jgi:hypothetical protein
MNDKKIVLLSGTAVPTTAMHRFSKLLSGPPVSPLLKPVIEDDGDNSPVGSLAKLMTEAMEIHQKPDGRIDMKDVAQHVLEEMARHQKKETRR